MTPIERERARLEAVAEVITVQDAMDKLIAREYSIPDQEYSNDFLASILIQITAILPAEAASIVKAVAVLLSELELDMRADRATDALMDTLKGPFSEFIEVGSIVKSQAERIVDGHDSIDNRITDIIGRVDDIHTAMIESQEQSRAAATAAEDTHKTLQTLQNHIETLATSALANPPLLPPHADNPSPNSYANRARPPAIHDRVMARNTEKSRQVLFTKAKGMASQGLDTHDAQTIIAKANLALAPMKNNDGCPLGIQFMSAKTLAKGDIVFDLDSPESAEWLRQDDVRLGFMQGFGAMSEIKDREFSCVVENVPVGFHPSIESSSEVETINNLSPKSILLTRWIKPIERRFEGQRTAFMIFTFRTAEDANRAIQNALYICGKRCITRKLLPEPRRCFKCHAVNARHIAANCKEITDICDTCGGAHPSKECTLKDEDPAKHFCINCKTHGHGARDRLCPVYLRQCTELNTRMPENLYKFFPTANPRTWELTDSFRDEHHQQPSHEGNNDWTEVTNKKRKKYSFAPHDQSSNRNRTATSTNTIPLGQRKDKDKAQSQPQPQTQTQTFLDDIGFTNFTRPGPSQQYRTPSQRQRAESYRSTHTAPTRSLFSPLSIPSSHIRSPARPAPSPPLPHA